LLLSVAVLGMFYQGNEKQCILFHLCPGIGTKTKLRNYTNRGNQEPGFSCAFLGEKLSNMDDSDELLLLAFFVHATFIEIPMTSTGCFLNGVSYVHLENLGHRIGEFAAVVGITLIYYQWLLP